MNKRITPQGLSPAQDVEESLDPLSQPVLEEQILQRLRSQLGDGLPDSCYRRTAKGTARLWYIVLTGQERTLARRIERRQAVARERKFLEWWKTGGRRGGPGAA